MTPRRRRLSEHDYRRDATMVQAIANLTRMVSERHGTLPALVSAATLLDTAQEELEIRADALTHPAPVAAREPSE